MPKHASCHILTSDTGTANLNANNEPTKRQKKENRKRKRGIENVHSESS